jgi:hypothetical protein
VPDTHPLIGALLGALLGLIATTAWGLATADPQAPPIHLPTPSPGAPTGP